MSELESDVSSKSYPENPESECEAKDNVEDQSHLTTSCKKLCYNDTSLPTSNEILTGECKSVSPGSNKDYVNTVLKPSIQNIVCDNTKRSLSVNKNNPNICLSSDLSSLISNTPTPSGVSETPTKPLASKATEMQFYMDKLKEMVPYAKNIPKISKVQLIHCAIDYITDLQESLEARVKRKITNQSCSLNNRSPLADLSVTQQNHSNISSEEMEPSSTLGSQDRVPRLENQDTTSQLSSTLNNSSSSNITPLIRVEETESSIPTSTTSTTELSLSLPSSSSTPSSSFFSEQSSANFKSCGNTKTKSSNFRKAEIKKEDFELQKNAKGEKRKRQDQQL